MSNEKCYVKLGNPKKIDKKSTILALTIAKDIQPVVISGVSLSWSRQAIKILSDIQLLASGESFKNLPYMSLRGLLQVRLTNLARLNPDVGLRFKNSNSQSTRDPEPFAYVIGDDEASIVKMLRSLLNDWIINYLKPFTEREEIGSDLLDNLEDLREQNELITISKIQSQILPWAWDEKTGTTQPAYKNFNAYHQLVDYTARSIAGHEIFSGLGEIKRIIPSHGAFSGSIAELITQPIELDAGIFSLVVKLEVVTFPSVSQPVIMIDVSKRRWLSRLEDPKFDRQNISGFAFANLYTDRVFSFQVSARKDGENDISWLTSHDFDALRRQLDLPMKSVDGKDIAMRRANTDKCSFFLNHRHSLGKHGIDAGVPEIDKLKAFEAIEQILQPRGFDRFTNFDEIKASHSLNDEGSRMLNTPTLLNALIQQLLPDFVTLNANYLEEIGLDKFKSVFNTQLGISLDRVSPNNALAFDKRFQKNQTFELQKLIQSNQSAIQRLFPNEQICLIIFHESSVESKRQASLVAALVRLLWGNAIETLLNTLPDDVHGAKVKLPGSNLTAKERSKLRQKSWEPIAKQIKAQNRRTFCLVMASKFYSHPTKPDSVSPDDRINKPSTRRALASIAGSCVQFLLPMEKTKEHGALKLEDFFHRVQSALKDLLFAHSGYFDDTKQKVDKWLDSIPTENRPKEIIGITIVRKQKGRVKGVIENTFLPIAIRLNVETGKCEMCCAYQHPTINKLEISTWKPFADALTLIAQISPIKLADKRDVRKVRFMEFVKQVISESAEAGSQPLVVIDSSNCVQLWGWLADIRMNAAQIDLGTQYQQMEQEWKGVRIVRVRQGLAPGAIEKTQRQIIESSIEDSRTTKDLKTTIADRKLDCASSSTSKLFRLNSAIDTGCIAYLSVGNKLLHKTKRGQSCYRNTEQLEYIKDNDSKNSLSNAGNIQMYRVVETPPFIGQYPTPNPLEIVITLRQAEDDPDKLAALVESLRYGLGHYGDWATLPAPLFFERVVRDYISEFSIDEDEDKEDMM